MTAFIDQLPPHDIQAEDSVVASLIVDEDAMAKVSQLVDSRDFFRDSNRWTFEACKSLWERGEGINQVTVSHELERTGRLDDVGGLTYVSELILNLPTPIGVEHFAAIVKRDAVYRQMISAANTIAQVAYQGAADIEGAIARAESLIYGLRAGQKTTDFTHLREYLDAYFDVADVEPGARLSHHIRTGLSQLDALLAGLKPGQLIIVAARTSAGKTSLMLNFARNGAVCQNAKIAMFSLEMSGEELADRILTAESRVETRKLRAWTLNETEERRVMRAHGLLSAADIYVDYSPSLKVTDLRQKCLRLSSEQGLDLVVVDYLQLLGSGKSFNNRVTEIGFLTGELKRLAGELDVPVVVGCQLSRKPEERPGHVPILSDLRESGSIEQDADVVIFILRDELYSSRADWERTHTTEYPYPEGIARLLVAKNRAGDIGNVDVRFRKALTKFEDFDIPAGAAVQAEAAF